MKYDQSTPQIDVLTEASMFHRLPHITDPALIQELFTLEQEVVDESVQLNVIWLAKNKFTAIPMDRDLDDFFDTDDDQLEKFFRNLSLSAKNLGCSVCYAIPTEAIPLERRTPFFKVDMDEKTLDDFWHDCGGYNYILMPIERSFLLLWTAEDHIILAGPKNFVERVIECDLELAKNKFRQFAKNYRDNPHVIVVGLKTQLQVENYFSKYETHFLSMLERYENCNACC